MSRILLALWISGMMLIVTSAPVVLAQPYPSKPIRVLTTAAGGGSDFTARLVTQALSSGLGWQIIVDNRSAGTLSAEVTAKAMPDGYTLAVQGSGFLILPLMQKTPFDPVRDFTPVTMIERTVNILVVNAALPANSVAELITLARAKPGALNYGSASTGSANHLAAELFKSLAGVNVVRIAYKGTPLALADVINGQVQMMFATAASVMPHVKAGKLKALAVTTAQPSQLVPGVPTVAATVPGYESTGMTGMLAPAGAPRAIIEQLNREVRRVLTRSDIIERMSATGAEPVGSTPEEFAAFIKAENARMSKLIKDAGIKPE